MLYLLKKTIFLALMTAWVLEAQSATLLFLFWGGFALVMIAQGLGFLPMDTN